MERRKKQGIEKMKRKGRANGIIEKDRTRKEWKGKIKWRKRKVECKKLNGDKENEKMRAAEKHSALTNHKNVLRKTGC